MSKVKVESVQEPTLMYRGTAWAIRNKSMFRLKSGVWVGVGGSVAVKPGAPKLPFTIPEATQEQYKEIFERGHTKLVETFEKPKDETDNQNVEPENSNPGN